MRGAAGTKLTGLVIVEILCLMPDCSVIADALQNASRAVHQGAERLDDWQTSKTGPLGTGPIQVEAVRYGTDVWALVTLLPSVVVQDPTRTQRRPSEGQISF